ncbi:exo-beta-N-acetylmuramidase NamZ family protein [Propionibacteriaceae bacterium Y1685]|uniref:exo-beta-N-acetylmuramidase NamZ family protein n=1 Tax=Microlunatus sp. Y1700 TaxID=3418487 RepID=UPI003B82563E
MSHPPNDSVPSTPRVSRRGILAAAGAGAAITAGSVLPAQTAHAQGFPGRGRKVIPGADSAAADGWKVFSGRKIGIITNPTGIVRDGLKSIVDAMAESGKVTIGAVFGPEHGFRGTAQAGEAEDTYVDERTGVTVYDAYGANAAKFAKFYEESGVDTIVFDIQDVGVRFYTYIWTMYEAMIAAAKTGKEFIVLDRPNPVGGAVHGTMMTDGFTSGVGKDKIIQAHGMTAGEVARYFNGELLEKAAGTTLDEVQVVELKGWKPDMLFHDTNLPWILPSPNMPTPTTALLYYGTGMFEATNMSEGRGTTLPFELLGAPYVDHRWAKELNQVGLPGVEFREAYFTPTMSKNEGEVCGGVQVHVTDPYKVASIEVTTHMFTTARDLYPDDFAWRALDGSNPGRWLGLLTGSKRFQELFEAGKSAEEIIAAWRPDEKAFDAVRQPYLIYKR